VSRDVALLIRSGNLVRMLLAIRVRAKGEAGVGAGRPNFAVSHGTDVSSATTAELDSALYNSVNPSRARDVAEDER
jgi:hypothetical protein